VSGFPSAHPEQNEVTSSGLFSPARPVSAKIAATDSGTRETRLATARRKFYFHLKQRFVRVSAFMAPALLSVPA